MVRQGEKSALSFFCIHLDYDTVLTMLTWQNYYRLCLQHFETVFMLILAGVLSEIIAMFHPLRSINKETKAHCPRTMELYSKSVTEYPFYISVRNAYVRLITSCE